MKRKEKLHLQVMVLNEVNLCDGDDLGTITVISQLVKSYFQFIILATEIVNIIVHT